MSLFQGLSAFPITPADKHGRVNSADLAVMLRRLGDAEVDSVGLLGSTGTYAYLARSERRRAVEIAVDCLGGRTPVIVSVGALRTDDAVALAQDAKAIGADGLLLAPVSYTPLTDDEVFEHYVAVTEAAELPLCIYNNPGTTHFTFSEALLKRLAAVPHIVAVKNPAPAPADVRARHEALRAALPRDFAIGYSGDWNASAAVLAGGVAWYSVVAGLLPKPALMLMRAAQAGDTTETERVESAFLPLWDLFKELSSIRVVHMAADIMGLCRAELPRPLLPLADDHRPRVGAALDTLARL